MAKNKKKEEAEEIPIEEVEEVEMGDYSYLFPNIAHIESEPENTSNDEKEEK